MENVAVRIENVTVDYRLLTNRPTSVKELAIRWTKRDIQSSLVSALDRVSAEIRAGEAFGVIGRNGAGKSTLLKVISGIIHPTYGRVRVWGQAVPLLGVGAGFHPELTGRENIFLYSALLGRTNARTLALLDEIIGFAELSDFIDSPIRVYSRGMKARLGFSVALAERPGILLIDEVLAVGDEKFQDKCRRRFSEYRTRGTTVVIVSHSMRAINSLCERAIWLLDGRSENLGETEEVVRTYQQYLNRTASARTIRSE